MTYEEDKSHLYPRCEYKTRFYGSSVFEMSQPSYWQTYFRSDLDRLARVLKEKKGTKVHAKGLPWKTGGFKHPFEIYKEEWEKETENLQEKKAAERNGDFYLYEDLLKYKCSMCDLVVELFKQKLGEEKTCYIDVYYKNDYPCVMVQIHAFNELSEKNEKSESKYLYRIIQAYFTAIACFKASDQGIPIELVNRTSFGHNIPSVDETGTSLRINIGIIPKVYAEEVLVESLFLLNKLIPEFLETKIFRFDSELLKKLNENIALINVKEKSSRKPLDSSDTVFVLLKQVAKQIMESKYKVDDLTNIIFHMLDNDEKDFFTGIFIPLKIIFEEHLNDITHSLLQKKKENTIQRNSTRGEMKKFEFKEAIENIKDEPFWQIMEKIYSTLGKANSNGSPINKRVSGSEKLSFLYSSLENANLNFMKSYKVQTHEDSFESDSDSDDSKLKIEDHQNPYFSTKIILSTGMRAIYMAHRAAVYLYNIKSIDAKIKIDTDINYMYFETAKAVKKTCDKVNMKLQLECLRCTYTILYIDLSHYRSSSKNTTNKFRLTNIKKELNNKQNLIIFDCTRVQETDGIISRAKRLFAPCVRVLMFVDSGLERNEPVRICSTDEIIINELYSKMIDRFSLKVPKSEEKIKRTELYSKEISIPIGMEAIDMAHYAAQFSSQTSIKKNTISMCFETNDVVLQRICKHENEKLPKKECNETVTYIDLNHCTSSGPNTNDVGVYLEEIFRKMKDKKQNNQKHEVIVFDYTSASTSKIRKAIRLFAPNVEVLLLVNSGLKNEQIGADMNPYGTLRIISNDKFKVKELYDMITNDLGEKGELPYASHCVRNLYRSVGAVITMKDICNEIEWGHTNIKRSTRSQLEPKQLEDLKNLN